LKPIHFLPNGMELATAFDANAPDIHPLCGAASLPRTAGRVSAARAGGHARTTVFRATGIPATGAAGRVRLHGPGEHGASIKFARIGGSFSYISN